MNKDFSQDKLLSFSEPKILKVLYDLATIIEESKLGCESKEFIKLTKYHLFLKDSPSEFIQKITKEFNKIKNIDYQFQVYLMNLERVLGQSKKDYQFLVQRNDNVKATKKIPVICLLDSIRSAHNVGSFFRNAECFGVEKIVLTGLSPTPENKQVQKTAMGTDNFIPWEYHKSALEIIKKLKDDGFTIWSIETGKEAIDINDIQKVDQKIALIFGHEQFGISLELLQLSDSIININLLGKKNSLNVACSQAIILNKLSHLYH